MTTLMQQEIFSEPTMIKRTIASCRPVAAEIAKAVKEKGIVKFVTLARGTSDNAATVFSFLCPLTTGIQVGKFHPSLYTVYNKAVETNSDAVQFNFQTIRGSANIKHKGQNGNKPTGIYEKDAIIYEYLPRFVGYSKKDIQAFGTVGFHAQKEMGAVWRFLYKRSVIVEHNIMFPVGVRLNEDSLFNCRFFCFASKICYIGDVLYTYYSKDEGAMYSSLKDLNILFENKLAAKNERVHLQKLYLKEHGVDIFPLFAGSLFLSAVEIAVKSEIPKLNKLL